MDKLITEIGESWRLLKLELGTLHGDRLAHISRPEANLTELRRLILEQERDRREKIALAEAEATRQRVWRAYGLG